MAWFDYDVTTVGVHPGGDVSAVRTRITATDPDTGTPVALLQGGTPVAELTPDADGHLTFQADARVVELRALGWSLLAESRQQQVAKGDLVGDLDAAADGAIDRAEAAGRILSPAQAAATYLSQSAAEQAYRPDNGEKPVGKGELVVNVRDYRGLVGGLGLDWDVAYAAALVDVLPGGTILNPDDTPARFTAPVTVGKPVTLAGGTIVTPADGRAFDITASRVTVKVNEITGPGALAGGYTQGFRVIQARGTSSAPLERVIVEGVTITGTRDTAIWMEWVTRARVRDNVIRDFRYAGVMLLSATDSWVVDNDIANAYQDPAVGNSYGIAVSDLDNTAAARSRRVRVHGNRVDNVPEWEGIDSHGGEGLIVTDNIVTRCRRGIQILVGNPTRVSAPQRVVITGNVIDGADIVPAAATTGISLVGKADLTALASGVATSNVITNCTTPVQKEYVDAASTIVAGNVGADGVWTSYTPSFNGTLGNGTLTGRFMRVGTTVHFAIRFVVGSTTAQHAAASQFGLPVGSVQSSLLACPVARVGTGTSPAVARAASTTTLFVYDTNGVVLAAGNAFGTSLVAGHELRISGTYEVA